MPRDATLLTDDELLAEEAAIKKKLSDLDNRRLDKPRSSFIATIQQLDARLEIVLSELGRRKRP